MNQILLEVTTSAIDWARAQFALTAIYHWLFVPLTLGLAVVMGIAETCYYRTKKQFWKDVTMFWQKLFGINFAMGVATGIILEFEFGTNWSNYSWFVGDIFGAPLAVEGIVAFFMESTFVAVMFFGWKKVSPGFHLASTWLTGLGATISAWWILVANAWMQYPVGCQFNPDTMRNEMVSFAQVALSPFAIDKFSHTVTSSWIVGAIFTVGVSCWYLLHKREQKLALASIKIGAVVGVVASLLAMATGDSSAHFIGKVQPMKLAAMEAHYNGKKAVPLTLFAPISPFSQPDYQNEGEESFRISIPYCLSILTTRTIDGYVPGVNDFFKGFTRADGTRELSFAEKIAKGRMAIESLAAYRKAKKAGDEATAQKVLPTLQENMPYFGYGYVKDVNRLVPPIGLTFWSFRVMVGAGCYLLLLFLVVAFVAFRSDITRMRWLHRAALLGIPVAYLGSEAGWVLAEMGRQPWTIQDMLPTWVAVSDVTSGSIATTFFIFLVLFTTMLAVEINILCKQIKKGPEYGQH